MQPLFSLTSGYTEGCGLESVKLSVLPKRSFSSPKKKVTKNTKK